MKDLIARRASRQRKAPAQYLQDRWRPDVVSQAEEDADTTSNATSTATPSPYPPPPPPPSPINYQDLNFEQKRSRLEALAERHARRRKARQQREERGKKERRKERHQRDRQKRSEKNEQIAKWRGSVRYREVPPGIERQFPRRSRVPAKGENRYLVQARSSRTMLEVA